MGKAAIMTDTNSGITPDIAEKNGIFLLKMPFFADGKEYTYKYEGTTTYQNVPYYNFSVSDGGTTVINILVSGDGARIYKGTNTNGSWSMQ